MIAELETNWPLFFVNWLWSLVGTRPIWTNVGAWRGLPVAGNEAQPDGRGPGWDQDRAQTQEALAKGSAEVLGDGRRGNSGAPWQCLGTRGGGNEREDLQGRESWSRHLRHTGQTQGWGLEPSDVFLWVEGGHSSETQAAPSSSLMLCYILQAMGPQYETAPQRLLFLLSPPISLSSTPSLNP